MVDLALVLSDPSDALAEQMEAWELSAKYKHASLAAEYAAKNPAMGIMSLSRLKALDEFVRDPARSAKVSADRAKYWCGTHPRTTWTGKDLGQNCKAADAVYPSALEDFRGEITFESRYETEYRQLCWSTHGSTGIGVRGLEADTFHVLSAQAYHHAHAVGFASIALGLHAWGFDPSDEFDVDVLVRRLDRARSGAVP